MAKTQLIFDTNCVLCSGFVRFILRHERDDEIVFIGSNSPAGLALAAQHDLSASDLDETFLVVADGIAYVRSNAALKIASHFKAPWRWARIFKGVPRPLRDGVYTLIARRRYRWFGYTESCMVPTPNQRHRFIDL